MAVRDIDNLFERQLEAFSSSTADRTIFNLGRPSGKVRSAGVSDKPIKLYGSKVMKKIRKHGFGKEELRGLTKSVRNPIAVFKNNERPSNYSILTSLKTRNGNFLVAIEMGSGADAKFNIVTTVFGKGKTNIIDWINRGRLRYVDKKKALNYLHLAAPIAAASDNQGLISAAKIVKRFKNNKTSGSILSNAVQ